MVKLAKALLDKGLSLRELQVAEGVSKGWSNKEIADDLGIKEKTVKFHLTSIYTKINVKSRAQLIVWCLPYLDIVEVDRSQAV